MADYKIKFEYKGMGKQASTARTKALQASKGAKLPGVSDTDTKSSISNIKNLNSSILKLIRSNEKLANALGGKGGGGGGGGGRGVPSGGGAGFGNIGASIPILGAAIGMLGFTIQKTNQIGNAYIEKVSEQLGNVGVGGFRRGRGVYTATQMGGGMKAYGMARGTFARKAKPNQAALNVGAVYGLSAEETLRQAGTFERMGMNYGQAANVGLGAGIETELPMFLNAMTSSLTDAVREGINTSDMSKDMAKDLSELIMRTPAKSVESAMAMVRSFQGVGAQVSRGKVNTMQSLMATKAAQSMFMEQLTGASGGRYVNTLLNQGAISKEQAKNLRNISATGGTWENVQQAVPNASWYLLRKHTQALTTTNPVAFQQRTIEEGLKSFTGGRGIKEATPEQKQRFMDVAAAMGFTENPAQMETLLGIGEKRQAVKGAKPTVGGLAKGVTGSAPARAVQRTQMRENLLFKYGESFADASFKMEKAMIKIADKTAPAASASIEKLGQSAEKLSLKFDAAISLLSGTPNSKQSKLKKILESGDWRKIYEHRGDIGW